jgi:hypothetical protein
VLACAIFSSFALRVFDPHSYFSKPKPLVWLIGNTTQLAPLCSGA